MSAILEQVIINRIMEYLKRDEIVDTDYVNVQFHDGTVTLQGTVFSEQESRETEWMCWVDGVTGVDNRLVVYVGDPVEKF